MPSNEGTLGKLLHPVHVPTHGPSAHEHKALPAADREHGPENVGSLLKRPPRGQHPVSMEALDNVAAGLVNHAHSVIPGRRNRLVRLAGRQERPGYTVDLGHVVPPELDERPKALIPLLAAR